MSTDTDFLIIGGGIAGLSVAARLAPHGRVTVLESEDHVGYHTSGRSAAMYEPNYGSAPVRALNQASLDTLTERGVLSPRGVLMVGLDSEKAVFTEDARDMGMDPVTVQEALAMVPILNPETSTLFAFHDTALDIDTDALLQSFARDARGNGEVLTGAPVTRLSRTTSGWEVETNKGLYSGRILINAAGAWADHIARLAGVTPIGLQPYRRSMARLKAPGGHDVSKWPMIFGAGETWYAKPDAGGLIVSPAEEDPMDPHDAYADDMVLAEGLARYEHHVTEPVTRPIATWAGLRSFAPDRALCIGFAPDDPAFFWQAGQGGYGFQTSAGAATLAADLITGRSPEIGSAMATALNPARFS